jgi:hypothetical protein
VNSYIPGIQWENVLAMPGPEEAGEGVVLTLFDPLRRELLGLNSAVLNPAG